MNCIGISYSGLFKYRLRLLLNYICNAFSVMSTEKISNISDRKTETVTTTALAEEAMNNYGNAILRLAYSYLHNMSDAEDVLQDTLIKFMESAPDFQTEHYKKAWLLKVASNLSKNKIDYNRTRETDELEENLVAEENENLSFVWDAVKKLPENYREVIHLYYQEGYKTKEIGKILNRNESSCN